MNTILIAENNKDFVYVIHWFFKNKGYTVFSSGDGEEILKLYNENTPDIILLDIGLDGNIDGKEVARRIRFKDRKTPIIFMSGENNSPTDVVEAFGIGGNFFLKKPVTLEEIEAHIDSALKQKQVNNHYNLGKIVFNVKERLLSGNGINETLTEKETQVLQSLAENLNMIIETIDILLSVWGTDDKEESLRNTISSLRKKLERTEITIETIKGRGYRLGIQTEGSPFAK